MLESGTVTAVAVAITALITALMALSNRHEQQKTQRKLEETAVEKAKFDAAVEAKHQAIREEELAKAAREKADVAKEEEMRRRITDEIMAGMTENLKANSVKLEIVHDETKEIKHQTNGMSSKQEEHIKRLEEQIKHLESVIVKGGNESIRDEVKRAVKEALAGLTLQSDVPQKVEVMNVDPVPVDIVQRNKSEETTS